MSLLEKKNKIVSLTDECLTNAVKNEIFHLNTNGDALNGRTITLNNNQNVLNFGSCSYLGLEMDERLKEGAIDAIRKYGTQFSSSRAFLSSGQYEELESLHSKMFNSHCIVSPTTTLGHAAAIPSLVADNDAIIYDVQVHGSVQNAFELIKSRGVHSEVIHHNDMNEFEEKIKKLRNKHYRIWYLADGVYSMYGDYAPIKELYSLMDKYKQLHLYIDDAHGMSWTGKNGTGYVTSQVQLRPQVYLATSMAKGYGSGGGILVFQDKEDMRKVRTVGSSFVFSGPIQPAVMGANIASAKIHLSDDIYRLQNQLKEKLVYTDYLIREKKLPYVFSSGSPIFYIGLGLPAMGYNIVKKLIDAGFYVDIGIFPGVSSTKTGLRLAINNNMTFEDIKNVIDAIEHFYPKALLEEGQSIKNISRYFKQDFSYANHFDPVKEENDKPILVLKHFDTIEHIDKEVWNDLMGERGSFDYEGCKFLEDVFVDNPEPENNWKFHYYFVYEGNKPILATFVTELLCKDDMLSAASISEQIEKERKADPYFLTSKVLMMGSLLTEGEHLFIDKSSELWREALDIFIKNIQLKQEHCGATAIYLRDISTEDKELEDYFMNKGFIKNAMPDSWVIDDLTWETKDEYIQTLSSNSRSKVRKNIFRHSSKFEITTNKQATEEDLVQWKSLYNNVKGRSLSLNTFSLPDKIFKKIAQNSNWEVLKLSVPEENNALSSIVFSYKSKKNYCPMFLGIDYDFTENQTYRQALYQTVERARKLDCKNLFLGMEAGIEKKTIGAKPLKRSVYIQLSDNFIAGKLQSYNQ